MWFLLKKVLLLIAQWLINALVKLLKRWLRKKPRR